MFFCDIGEKKTLFHPEIVFFFHAKKLFLFFAHGSRLVADLILKNSVFHLSIETKVNIKLATDVICNERLELDGKSILCSHLSIGSTQNANTKNSFVFALSLHQTISENSAFWPKHEK